MNGIIEMEIKPGTARRPEDCSVGLADEVKIWEEIEALRDRSLEVNNLEFGRLFRNLREKYKAPGRKGRGWEAIVEERGFSTSKVKRWIYAYEKSKGMSAKPSSKLDGGSRNDHENNDVKVASPGNSAGSPSQSRDWDAHTAINLPVDAKWQFLSGEDAESETQEELPEEEQSAGNSKATVDLDTPEGRYNYMYKAATRAFVYRGSVTKLIGEWQKISDDITTMLESFKIQDGGAILPRREND
jgi:hypothetical protein